MVGEVEMSGWLALAAVDSCDPSWGWGKSGESMLNAVVKGASPEGSARSEKAKQKNHRHAAHTSHAFIEWSLRQLAGVGKGFCRGRTLHPPFWLLGFLERAKGIEPSWPAWKAGTLPLSYARNPRALYRPL